jgi:acyl-coenzyme A thioesterase PaaI-like protein
MENALTPPQAASPSVVDFLARFRRGEATPPPMAELIGMQAIEIEPGRAVFDLEVDPVRHANPMGTLHGGVLCTLADSAMGMA